MEQYHSEKLLESPVLGGGTLSWFFFLPPGTPPGSPGEDLRRLASVPGMHGEGRDSLVKFTQSLIPNWGRELSSPSSPFGTSCLT